MKLLSSCKQLNISIDGQRPEQIIVSLLCILASKEVRTFRVLCHQQRDPKLFFMDSIRNSFAMIFSKMQQCWFAISEVHRNYSQWSSYHQNLQPHNSSQILRWVIKERKTICTSESKEEFAAWSEPQLEQSQQSPYYKLWDLTPCTTFFFQILLSTLSVNFFIFQFHTITPCIPAFGEKTELLVLIFGTSTKTWTPRHPSCIQPVRHSA